MRKILLLVLCLFLLIGCGSEQRGDEISLPDIVAEPEPDPTIELEKEIFYELIKLQDSVSDEDPTWSEWQGEAKEIIGAKHNKTPEEINRIIRLGIKCKWPVPPPPSPRHSHRQ